MRNDALCLEPDGSGGQGVSVYDPEARMPESRRPISPREG